MMQLKNKYRIVTDNWLGYEVQVKKWWFPIWVQAHSKPGYTNTYPTIEKAEEFARNHSSNNVVKILDI